MYVRGHEGKKAKDVPLAGHTDVPTEAYVGTFGEACVASLAD